MPTRYLERRHELAVGLEAVDAVRGSRVTGPLLALREVPVPADARHRLAAERRLVTGLLPALRRLESCRHTLLRSEVRYDPADPWVEVRLVEGRGQLVPRRFVPRRLRIPLTDPAAHDTTPLAGLIRRPALMPGAAYPIHASATVLRGRVLRGGEPVRWARVEALAPDGPTTCPGALSEDLLAVAHGDDRGEFLLVLPPAAATVGAVTLTTTLCIRAWAHDPPPADAETRATDPHWDLPREDLPATEAGARIEAGWLRPASHTHGVVRRVTLRLGRTTSGLDPFLIP
jgi:hypothetical protein